MLAQKLMSGTTPKPLDEEKGEKEREKEKDDADRCADEASFSFSALLSLSSFLRFIRPSHFSLAAFALGGRQRADKETA